MMECLVKRYPVHDSTWMNECFLTNTPQDYTFAAEEFKLEFDTFGYTLIV